jgi:hypothetical protein
MAKAFEAEGLTIERYNDKLLHVFRCDFETWIGPHVWNANDQAMYSHVIMNPPFDHQLRHVVRAYEFLRPGRELRSGDVIEAGCLTSIMGANVLTGQDGDFVKFRAWLEAKGAMIERLPSGSFRPSGTDVETIMVKVPGPWAD